jgi:hypothetical protein
MNYRGEEFELRQEGSTFVFRFKYGIGAAGDEETALDTIHRIIDENLAPPEKRPWWKRFFK